MVQHDQKREQPGHGHGIRHGGAVQGAGGAQNRPLSVVKDITVLSPAASAACKDIDRDDIMPRGKERIEKMVKAFEGVSHIIIDEMSMVGRRSLGQVDALLRRDTPTRAL